MKNKKSSNNIVFVGAKPPTNKLANPGGQVTASISLVEALTEFGYDVTIFDTTQASFPLPPLFKRILKGFSRLICVSYFLIFNKVEAILIFSGSGFSFIERILISIVARSLNVKTFFFMRDGHFQITINNSEFKRKLIQLLVKVPDFICIQSDSWKSFFIQKFNLNDTKLLVVRNWLSSEFQNQPVLPKNKNKKIVFCFVGWIVKEKGIVELLEASKILAAEGLDFELILAGGGDLEDFCKSFVINNNLDSFISLLGWQSSFEIKELYSSSDVFVLPSYAEGFPNSLLEALFMGLPIISTDVGGISDSLQNDVNGFLISPNNTSELLIAMKNYLLNPELIFYHGSNSKTTVTKLHDKKNNIKIILDKL